MSVPSSPQRRRYLTAAILLATAVVSGGIGLRAQSAYRQAQWREAYLPALEEEAKTNRSDTVLLSALALRQIEAHDFAHAAQTLQNAIGAGLNSAGIWKTWAAATAASGNVQQALGVLKLGSNDPSLADELKTSQNRLSALDPEASPEQIAQAISPEGFTPLQAQLAPNFWSGWIESRGRQNPETSGFITREKWAKEQPGDLKVQILWAKALTQNRRYPDAEQVLIPILKKDPNQYDAAIALAQVRYAAGVPARAGIVYRACAKQRPNDFTAVLGVAQCAVDVQLVYLGVEYGEKAVKLRPDSVDAWIALGRAHFNQKLHWDKVVTAFEKARQLDPKRLDYYAPFYDALRATGKTEEGEKMLRERLSQVPNDARAHFLLATALLDYRADQGRTQEAEKALRRSMELEPNAPITAVRLGQILLEKGDAKEAATALERAVMQDNYQLQARQLLGRAYRILHYDTEAAAMERSARGLGEYLAKRAPLEDAQAREPSNVAVQKKLAKLYEEGGELDKAEKTRQIIYMLEHRTEEAKAGLEQLMTESALSASTEWLKSRKPQPTPTPAPKQ